MGRVVLWMQASVDGFTEGPNGEFDWPIVADDTHTYFNEKLEQTAGAFLYGRRTFEMMAGFWPTALDSDHANTARFARMWVPMPKFVFSNSSTRRRSAVAWSSAATSPAPPRRDGHLEVPALWARIHLSGGFVPTNGRGSGQRVP